MNAKHPIKKRVALFGDSDSQIFGLLTHAKAFHNRGWHVSFLIDESKSIPKSVLERVTNKYDTTYMQIEALIPHLLEAKYDVVGVFSRASQVHRFRYEFEKLGPQNREKRTGVFTGYNGLVFEKFEEGLAWRIGYDVIALNGPRDKLLLEEFVRLGKCHNQPNVISGLIQSTHPTVKKPDHSRKTFVFAEQVIVPNTKTERHYLVSQLVRIADSNPDWNVLIKCRVRRNEKTFHKGKHHLEKLLKKIKRKPNNIHITYENLPTLLENAHLFATISSTAIFESLNAGVPSFTISDFGIKNSYGTHVFTGSDTSRNLAEITDLSPLQDQAPNDDWLSWVGALGVEEEKLVDFFENRDFSHDHFEPQYLSENDTRIWKMAKRRYRFGLMIGKTLKNWNKTD